MMNLIEKRPWLSLAALAAAALAAYLILFGAVLQQPLVLGETAEMMAVKQRIAARTGSPKIIVAAGSNGRFSHSCAVIAVELGRPCVNMSVTAGVGPDALYAAILPRLQPGDVVYLPWEYGTWSKPRRDLLSDDIGAWSFRNDRARLWSLGPERMLRGAFHFDIRDLIESPAEMALSAAGIQRRAGSKTLDAQGDETANTPDKARSYAAFVRAVRWSPPPPPSPGSAGEAMLARFVPAARAKGAIVVGGLPTTFDDQPVSAEAIRAIAAIFERHGASFIALPNHSQYPRADFFDTAYHLQTPGQAAHSRLIAGALRPFLAQPLRQNSPSRAT